MNIIIIMVYSEVDAPYLAEGKAMLEAGRHAENIGRRTSNQMHNVQIEGQQGFLRFA